MIGACVFVVLCGFLARYLITKILDDNVATLVTATITLSIFAILIVVATLVALVQMVILIRRIITKNPKTELLIDLLTIYFALMGGIMMHSLYGISLKEENVLLFIEKYGIYKFTIAQFTGEVSYKITVVIYSLVALVLVMIKANMRNIILGFVTMKANMRDIICPIFMNRRKK
jgi:hypothetical protein